ncbi:transglutaminase-like domain-containing protein [Blastopirellula marina]|uniref:Transglutaminase n=1 Tax=Blastopirellula marina TaxID=124 RepID=A0A2S8GCS9_9BACT|nr:transglutaminase domain-containing protein [Blastopirellula marina]PQO42268.1 transglutaminase [Blastopirellula marina]
MASRFFLALLGIVLTTSAVQAQFGNNTPALPEPMPEPSRVATPPTTDPRAFEAGFALKVYGPATGIVATFPVPTNWEDQKVELVGQDLSPRNAKVRFVDLDGARMAQVAIPRLSAGETAKVLLRYQVDRSPVVAPTDPMALKIPDAGRLERKQRQYLLPSPLIESRDAQIALTSESLAEQETNDWDKVKAYYDFVHENITYENGPMKGAVAALAEGRGDCEEMTTLFVALCRAGGVPARTVWVPGHCYPEFLTQTNEGMERWVAVEMTNNFPFGESPEKRPILQKGDNFRIPGDRTPQHYVKQNLVIRDYKGTSPPEISWLPPPGKEPPRAD